MMPKSPWLFRLTKVNQTKNEISNFMSVSILNAKIYEKVIKDKLVSGLDKYFLPFISAYRKVYSTQHVLTCLSRRMETTTRQ